MQALKMKIGRLSLLAALALGSAPLNGAPVFDPAQQPYGQVPPLAITGFNLATGTQKAFQAWFDGYSWSGDVVAYPIGTNGKTDVTARLWSAADVYAAAQACYATDPAPASVSYFDTGRKIVTRNGATNVAFRWANLSASQQASLDADPTKGGQILNYVRGDRSLEKYQQILAGDGTLQSECGVLAPAGLFRARTNILGDILHTRPVFVAAPPADFLFDDYQTFKANNVARAPRLYVGANDGMVHALDAGTGAEVWAYIPSMLVANLKQLSVDPYAHTYFIDGSMTVSDVNFGTTAAPDWRTVIIGGLGAGGQGWFALDVTDAGAANETAAAAKILWEITPAGAFADVGHTYGDPVIARLSNGQWAAIVSNGYNNTASGQAALYVIDIKTGALIKSFTVGTGSPGNPNGLSTPVAVDLTFDGKVDRVYAGDIDGNLWKFDISATDPATWTTPATPLFAAGQAIIGAPDVAAHPITGFLVTFATGRLFTAADATDSTVQNFAYGIWDGAPAANTTILDQTLTEVLYGGLQRVRTSSGLPINWDDASDPTNNPLHKGWRTALPPGERVLGTGFVRDARYQFTSVNPTIVNTPPPDGENWLDELDYLTGGVADKLIFDLNSDSLLTSADRVTDALGAPVAGPTGIPVAIYQGSGLLSQPLLAILSPLLSTTLFNQNPFFSPGGQPINPPVNTDPGVAGGHFDVDIYYATTNKHTHEYDDIFNVTGVNFLNASDTGFNVSNAITNVTTPFKILISNQRLSPAVRFSFGGQGYQIVTTLQTSAGLTMASLPTFTRSNITTLKYDMPKDAFESRDWGTGEVRAGLHPTQTKCVREGLPLDAKAKPSKWPTNQNGTLGPAGEVRNGALLFQLVMDTTPDSAVMLSDPGGDPRYGYRLKDDAASHAYHLAEWSTFWHHPNGKCMGDGGWTQTPPLDTSPAGANQKTPAAGSEDPPRDQFGTVTSVTVNTIPDPSGDPAKTIRTTTTYYSSGAQVIVTEWLTGTKVTKTTIEIIPPKAAGGGGGGGGGGGPGQSVSAPNTVTGYQQTRNSGKLGRVTWHELFGLQ